MSHSVNEKTKYLAIDEVAQMLSISEASVRNWMKSGIIPYEKKGRVVQFEQSKIAILQKALQTGTLQKLTTRRNKTLLDKNIIPSGYVTNAHDNRLVAKMIHIAGESCPVHLLLLETALHLLKFRGHLSPEDTTLKRSLVEQYLAGTLSLDRFKPYLQPLLEDICLLQEDTIQRLRRIADLPDHLS